MCNLCFVMSRLSESHSRLLLNLKGGPTSDKVRQNEDIPSVLDCVVGRTACFLDFCEVPEQEGR